MSKISRLPAAKPRGFNWDSAPPSTPGSPLPISIDKAVNHLRRERRLANPDLLRHVSPLGWEHIVLTGDYDWNSGAAERTNARPLNLHSARIRA